MQITIQNLLGIKHADIKSSPITFISGANGAGKSSVAVAIRLALLGEVERITLKKHAAELAHNSAKDYGVKVAIGDDVFSFGKAFGNHHENSKYLGIVTGATRPAELKDADMQAMIIHLAGISLTAEEIKKRLSAYDPRKVEALMPNILKSWDDAESAAKTHVTGLKAVWKSITGEPYGEVKASSWAAYKPDTNPERLAELDAELGMLQTQIEQLGKLETEGKTKNTELQNRIKNLESHREHASKIDSIKDLLAGAEKALDDHKADIANLEELASGTPEPVKYDCPCCKNPLMFANGALAQWEHEGKAPDLEAKASLKRLIESLDIRVSQVTKRKKELDQAVASKAIADDIERDIEGKSLIDITEITEQISTKRAEFDAASKERNALSIAAAQSATADEKTANAASHHADIKEWDAIKNEMSPTGLRQKLITTALDSFNEAIGSIKTIGIPTIRIGINMIPTLNDRPYYLLSESEQWRVNAVLSLAISMLSDIKIAVIDRFDVLSVKDRPPFFRLFAELTKRGDMNHIVVAGTLKEPPNLPPPYSVYWMDDGVANLVGKNSKINTPTPDELRATAKSIRESAMRATTTTEQQSELNRATAIEKQASDIEAAA